MYQDYSFIRKHRYPLEKNSDANPNAKFSYRCLNADSNDCKAYLRVNQAGDVLSAFIEHNHMPKTKEEIEPDFSTDMEAKSGKTRCTKRQIKYLIDYMLKNQDLETERNDNSIERLDQGNNKWQKLAFDLAKIGHPKSIQHLQKTWRDIKKSARAEIVSLAAQPRSTDEVVPSEKTRKVFGAMGQPIAKSLEPQELSDLVRKITSSSCRPIIFKPMAASKQDILLEKQASADMSAGIRCTKAQITCLVNYMEQNKDFAMSHVRDSSFHKKWLELESKLAKIGPWKSVKHIIGTWRELKKHARRKSMVPAGDERPSANLMKVINIMGLPLVFLEPGETAEDHGYVDQPTDVAPTATETDENTEHTSDDDDDDSSGIWPIFEVDSYP